MYKLYHGSCRNIFEYLYFWSRRENSTVETHRKSVTTTTADTGILFYFISYGMLFSFLCQKKFLIKTISLTKYTGILHQLIGIFYFKIDYNDINYFIKKTDPVGTTTNATSSKWERNK